MTKLRILGAVALAVLMMAPDALAQRRGGAAEPLEVACAERWWEAWPGEARVQRRAPKQAWLWV